jgi:hypothetical protein
VRRSRLLPLGVVVTGLLVLAAVASRGRPLGGGGTGPGPTAGFFDYVFTSVVIVAALVAAVVVWAFLTGPRGQRKAPSARRRAASTLLFFAAAGAVAWAISTSGFQKRLRQAQQRSQTGGTQTQVPGGTLPTRKDTRSAHLRWDEVAVVLAFLVGLGVLAAAGRARRAPPSLAWRRAQQEAVSLAVDESLDDLRAEPDLRRAIIAAYARMERALAAAGLPRRPAEAPLEFVGRALGELETSGPAVRRLTDLFEWAKFSQHEPEPEMRDEAIAALVAVRDELRAPEADAVPA